jgi:hypothetical protein
MNAEAAYCEPAALLTPTNPRTLKAPILNSYEALEPMMVEDEIVYAFASSAAYPPSCQDSGQPVCSYSVDRHGLLGMGETRSQEQNTGDGTRMSDSLLSNLHGSSRF